MSNTKETKHLGYEILALALFLGGAFFFVSGLKSLSGDGGIPQNVTTSMVVSLLSALGLVSFLGMSLGTAATGGLMFMRPNPMNLRSPLALLVGLPIAGALLLGAFGKGGGIGEFLPGAMGAVGGGILAVVLALVVVGVTVWLALGMPSLSNVRQVSQLNPVAAALKGDEAEGVSDAEAAALILDASPPPAAAPGVREFELRSRGELPEGVTAIGAVEAPPVPEAQAIASVEPAPIVEEVAEDSLEGGVWIREPESAEEVVDAEDDAVLSQMEMSPLAPSWESEALEDEVIEDMQVDVALELPDVEAAELDDEEEEVEEDEVGEELEEEAAELDEGLDEEEDVEEDELEVEAAELDDEEEEVEEDEVEEELEEEAAELDEDDDEEEEVEEEELEVEAAELDDEEEEVEEDEVEEELEEAAGLDEDVAVEEEVEEEELEVEAAELDDEEEEDEVEEELEEEAAELDEDLDEEEEVDEEETEGEAAELEEVAEEPEQQAAAEVGALDEVFDGEDTVEEADDVEELQADVADVVPAAQPGLFDGQATETGLFEKAAAPVEEPVVELTPKAVEAPKVETVKAPEPQPKAEEAKPKAADEGTPAKTPVAPDPTVELTHDETLYRAGALFIDEGRVAVSMLQRRFDMGFKEATSLLDELQAIGLIGPYAGGKHRDILMTQEEWEQLAAV